MKQFWIDFLFFGTYKEDRDFGNRAMCWAMIFLGFIIPVTLAFLGQP